MSPLITDENQRLSEPVKNNWFLYLQAVCLLVVISVIDRYTGYEISFSIFYLWPIVWVASKGHRTAAMVLSVASAAIWCAADLAAGHTYSQPWIPYWNATTRFGFFWIASYLTTRFTEELQVARQLARTDAVTGLCNSRAFMDILKRELERTRRFSRSVTLVYMDLDYFKRLNDEYGHDRGDEVLAAFATALKKSIRMYDTAARLGGDEFAVLLPETSFDQAHVVVGKLKGVLMRVLEERSPFVTISIGSVTHRNPDGVQSLIRAADQLMYEVKESGRNDVRFQEIT